MNKNQIRKALQEVENILKKEKEVTVFAFIEETDDKLKFLVKENKYYKNGKVDSRTIEIKAENIGKASEVYSKEYVSEDCTEFCVFLADFGE